MDDLFKFVQIVWLLVEVETKQFCLQVLYEGLTVQEVPDDAVRERVAVQLQISCTWTTKDQMPVWDGDK